MSKFDDLYSLITQLTTSNVNIKIIALQEIWNIPYPELVNIPNFKFVHKTRNLNKGGGVAFYVKNDIHFKILNDLSHFIEKEFECLTIEATINKKKVLLSNIYRSPNPLNNTTQAEHVENFINYFDTHLYNLSMKNDDSFVFLDSNINLLSINNNQNAALYLETVYSNGYLQKVGKATRICKSSYSLIDHIVYKSNSKNLCSGTIVTDMSDHFMNFIGLSFANTQRKNEFRHTRDFSKSKMDNFNNELNNLRWNNVLCYNDVDTSFDIFWNDFITLFELHFPLKKVKFNKNIHKKQNFMTSGLLVSRLTKIELYKKSLVDHQNFHEKYKLYRNLFHKVIRASKQMYLDSNFKNYQKCPKKTWDLLKETTFGEKSSQTISEIQDNGDTINDPKIMATKFNNFFSHIGTSISDSVHPIGKPPEDFVPNYPDDKPKFNLDNTGPIHITDIIKSFDSKVSCDLDGLSLKLLKIIAVSISVPLAHIFNLSLDNGKFPDKLKLSRIVPVFKTGDPKLCDNYRPIALVNTLSKVLEKIVSLKLTNHLEINNLLYKHQYGFLRGRSTEQNLLHVINFISQSLNKGNFCIGIFLDLKKAFDVCSHDILLKKLKKFGIEGKAHDWFKSYLYNRKQKVDIMGNLSDETTINISVLQGTTLGPILFLCYINDIYNASSLATFLFADDTSCLAEHNNLNELIVFVNSELQKLANWFRSNKMAVNISKTKYIIFRTKGKKFDGNISPVTFNNNEIGVQNDPKNIFTLERVHTDNPEQEHRFYKLLGVYLDEYLSFDKHVSYICAKLSRANFCIKRATNKLSKKALTSLYYALVHPHLLYCNNILNCTSAKNLTKISKLQKKAIRIITKSKINSHTAPLFKDLKILPFEKLSQQSKLLFMHSICYNYAPKSFENVFVRNTDRNIDYNLRNNDEFALPMVRIEFFKRFPLYSFPHAWNSLGDLIFQSNRVTFKIALKDYLLES